ncbi:probable calcium-binding protein CML30 [Cynara cardunculus var. scolymus]|nr:probable calcium-binding protein CML30 [Cynara cardunculus var. scolymus]
MKEKIKLTSASAITAGAVILMELRHACLTSIKYFIILYMFVEWLILLHQCYSLFVRPIWWSIFATQRTNTCSAARAVTARAADTQEFCRVGKNSLGVDVNMIMERLGMFWDRDGKAQIIVSEDIIDLFDEEEPSLDEVKEAFRVFDRNNDGFIDANELQSTLREMGYLRISEKDCRRMIDGYDVDKDERISFREFLKLMEDCL